MSDDAKLLALFDGINPASEGITRLRNMGVNDDQMEVISGIPLPHQVLGRKPVKTHVPLFALGGAVLGLAAAVFFLEGLPLLFPLAVGGQPLYPFPPLLVVGFELGMLGLMSLAFLGVFIDSRFPSDEPKEYTPEISEGKIAVVFSCSSEKEGACEQAMQAAGAVSISPVEARRL